MNLTKRFICLALLSGFMGVSGGANAQVIPDQSRTAGMVQPASDESIGANPTPRVSGYNFPLSITQVQKSGAIPPAQFPPVSTDIPAAMNRSPQLPKEETSQFQKFVKEATGTQLPVFGSQLFDSPLNYAPDLGLTVPSNYILGPGDEIRLQIWGAVEHVASLTIDRDGQVTLPKAGPLQLSGVSVSNLESVLKSHLGKVFTNFGLSASMGKLRSIQVYVVGQARLPGSYMVSSLSSLVNVLFISGGPNQNGSMRAIQLQRGGKVLSTFDLYGFIAKGDKSSDIALQPGDVIFVPPAGRRVAVTGAYDQSAIYELTAKPTTVREILDLNGATSPVINVRRALLERVYPDKLPPRQVIDLALDAKGLQQELVNGDILTLLPVSPAFANAVTLQGVVSEPMRYPWFEGMRVKDIIPDRNALFTSAYYKSKNQLAQYQPATAVAEADLARGLGDQLIESRFRNLADQVNWESAFVERFAKDSTARQLISFNLGKAVLQSDPSENILLQPGDVITVLSQKDIAVPQDRQLRLVRVEGEVAVPGIYQVTAGETLPQLLRRIGGISAQAYLFGAEFSRESVRVRQQENLGTLIRRLEAQLQSQTKSIVATNAQEVVASNTLLQQQQSQLQNQILRLKALKSNGRMTLELDPTARTIAALPPIPLEDGDRIYIPAVPSSIAAFGAVNNENAMLFKPGKNVDDLMNAAGLTEDAESDSMFLLRADGSVVSSRTRGWLWGRGFTSQALMPGDTLVVPAKLDRESGYAFTVRALKDWTQILSNLGIGAAAIKTLRD